MWIFTRDAFVSVVEHEDDPNTLVVRARKAEDIAAFLGDPEYAVLTIPGDYPFRAFVPRHVVAIAAAAAVRSIAYPNFKSSIDDAERHDFCLAVWGAGVRFQRGAYASSTPDPWQATLFDDDEPEGAAWARRRFVAEDAEGDLPF